MSNFLDNAGLSYFWQKLKAILESMQVATATGKLVHVTDAEAGSTVKSLTLYNSSGTAVTGKTVAITNKNLFRIDLIASSSTNKGVRFTKNSDGSISASGTSTGTYASTTCTIDKNAFVVGKTYTMNTNKTSGILYMQLALTYSDGTTDYLVSSNSPATFTITKTVTAATGSVQITASGATVNQTVWPQLEVGGAATSFVNNSYSQITYTGSNLPVLPASTTNLWSNDDAVTNISMTYYQDTASAIATSEESTSSLAMFADGKQDALVSGTNIKTVNNESILGSGDISTSLTILSYGHSTWDDFINAYNSNSIVYCRASSGSNPASGSQGRLAFMAYLNNATNPTEVEFQYYRSVSSHSDSQQGDQVYVYKLNSSGTWSVTIREAYTKITNGSGIGKNYSNGTITLSATFSGSYNDLTNKPAIPSKVTATDDGNGKITLSIT